MTPKFAVLIVDDNAAMASNLQDVLETKGYITTLANNGQIAVTLCRKQLFNLALIDTQLPDMTWIKLVEKLNKLSPGMRHIIITAHASLNTALATVRHKNIIAYETKPLDLDHILFLIRQATERWQAEEACLKNEKELATIFDSAPVVMILVDSERRVRRANRAAVRFFGCPAEEMIGLRGGEAFRCLHALDDPRGCGFGPHCQDCTFRNAVLDTFRTGENYHQVEAKIVVAVEGGELGINLLISTALLNLPESPLVLVCFENITQLKLVETEQKILTLAYQEQNQIIASTNLELEVALTRARQMEEALRESEEKYHAIFTKARDGIVLIDSETFHIVDCNPEFESQTGRQLEQLNRLKIWEVMPSEKIAAIKKKFLAIKTVGMDGSSELEFQKPDGQIIPIEFTAKKMKIKDRYYLQGIVRDITERRRATEELNVRMQILDEATDSIFVRDFYGKFVYLNEAAYKSCGYTRDELMGKNLHDFVVPQYAGLIQSHNKELLEKGTAIFESAHIRKDRSVMPVEVHVRPIKWGNRQFFLSVVRDITMRKQAETKLEESERNYRDLVETSHDLIWKCDKEGRFIYLNKSWERTHGYKVEEMLGKKFTDFQRPAVAATDLREFSRRHSSEMLADYETLHISKSDEEINLSFNSMPLLDAGGNIVGMQGTARDITEHKRIEKQLQHSQLLASLGEMTAGIAHEVNNPLGSILLYSELLIANNIPSHIKKDLKVIHDEAKRAAKIMTDLLTYGRRTKPQIRRLDLHGIIKKVLAMRQYQARVQNITISTNLADGPLYVKGDSSQLIQVFINLLLNAEEALKESKGGKIIISTQIDGKWAKVSVADNGTGIPPEKLGQVFHPFFTTKPVGEGTGLGLSTCYGIVAVHSGLIHAENNAMGGVTFTVELPLDEIKSKSVPSQKEGMARILSPRWNKQIGGKDYGTKR